MCFTFVTKFIETLLDLGTVAPGDFCSQVCGGAQEAVYLTTPTGPLLEELNSSCKTCKPVTESHHGTLSICLSASFIQRQEACSETTTEISIKFGSGTEILFECSAGVFEY